MDTSQDAQNSVKSDENVNINNSSLNSEESMTGDENSDLLGWKGKRESTRKKRREFSSKLPSVELWKGLYQRHWPQLLNYYNISLLGR